MTAPSTPLMQQYHAIKSRYPHALLLFRLGDFYELFYEDAMLASRELQITLTSRNREKGQPIPMCGVPYHAADGYVARLIRAGFKIAICDQMEQPGPGKKIIFAGIEDGDIGGGAGGDDPDNFAANDFFAGAGLLHLIADGDFEAGADEACNVAIGSVIRNAAHGNGLALFAIAGGQSDLQLAGGEHGVFVKQFVEIAEAEEQKRVGIAGFDVVVLLHQGCGGVGHWDWRARRVMNR